ncbi:MAG: hypothetical protein N2316_02945 [Spirochaetes bacterium]|nr:hypothetical protein [Spirochaetota bacterium]
MNRVVSMKGWVRIFLLFLSIAMFSQDCVSQPNGKEESTTYDVMPTKLESLSLSTALVLDVVIPGGGHFYMGNVYTGYAFASLKLLFLYFIYYSYRDWEYRRSLYRSAQRANELIDPHHELEFELPEGGYNTVEDFRRDYDRAAQRITFSVVGTVAVYVISGIITYYSVEKYNAQCVPTFEIGHIPNMHETERIFSLSILRRF